MSTLKITRVDKDYFFNVQRDVKGMMECIGWIKIEPYSTLSITQNEECIGKVKVKSEIFHKDVIFTPAINSFADPASETEKQDLIHKVLRMCLCDSPRDMGHLDTLFDGECGNCGKKIYDEDNEK